MIPLFKESASQAAKPCSNPSLPGVPARSPTARGRKAADVIEKHGQRICSLHLKDLAKDTKPDLTDPKSARSFMVRLAAGRVYIPAVIAAAKAKRISHFIIEDGRPRRST